MSVGLALAPIFGLILFGWALRRYGFAGEAFWDGIERLVYYVCFPALLTVKVAQADLANGGRAALVSLCAVLAVAALAFALRPLRGRLGGGPGLTSVFQGGVRFNSYVGLGAATLIHGVDGAALFAVVMGLCIPMINVLCVLSLSLDGAGQSARPAAVAKSLATNPLILGCAAGAALNLLGWSPPILMPAGEILAGATLPLGLLAVGTGLHGDTIRTAWPAVTLSMILKFLVFPLTALGFAAAFGATAQETAMALLFAALPTATSAYVLARRMGGDARAMAAIIAAQTAAAAVLTPAWLMMV